MSKRTDAGKPDHDNPEWTADDFTRAVPLDQLAAPLRRKPGGRGVQKAPTKERITIRLSRDVVDSFRATGAGWQTRVDAALRDWLRDRQA